MIDILRTLEHRRISGTISAFMALIALNACSPDQEPRDPTNESPTTSQSVDTSAPCEDNPMVLYAQNDFPLEPGQKVASPTNVRVGPNFLNDPVSGSLNPNEEFEAVAWEEAPVIPVPDNPIGYQGRIVFKTSLGDYVSSVGVRAEKTKFDSKGKDNTAEASSEEYAIQERPECEITD